MTDLTLEFVEGGNAAAAGHSRANCPHYATSNAADGWHAGHTWRSSGKSLNGVSRVTKGRGERVNIFLARRQVVAVVRWNDPSLADEPPVTFEPYSSERERQFLELRAKAPLQSKGKPVADAGHLPLFVSADEPSLF